MDAVQVENAIVDEETTLAPRFKLFSQSLVEPTDCTGTGSHTHQFFSDAAYFVGAGTTHKHLGQCLSHLRLIAVVALERLCMEFSFPIVFEP